MTFDAFCERVFGQTRQYVAGDRNVALKTLEVLAAVILAAPTKARKAALLAHVGALVVACKQRLPIVEDQELVAQRGELIRQMSDDSELAEQLRNTVPWVGAIGWR